MKEVVINSFSALHDIIEKYDARTVVYRGMKSVKFPLMPKVGRIIPPKSVGSKEANEEEILPSPDWMRWLPYRIVTIKERLRLHGAWTAGDSPLFAMSVQQINSKSVG